MGNFSIPQASAGRVASTTRPWTQRRTSPAHDSGGMSANQHQDTLCSAITAEAPTYSSPAQLVSGLPTFLEITPSDEVVIATLSGSAHQLVATARLACPTSTSPTDHVVDLVAQHLNEHHRAERSQLAGGRLVVVAYVDDERTAHAIADCLRTMTLDSGVEVLDRLVVWDGRWRSALCDDETCCPLQGTPIEPLAPSPSTALDDFSEVGDVSKSTEVENATLEWVARSGDAPDSPQAREFESRAQAALREFRSLPVDFTSRYAAITDLDAAIEQGEASPRLIAAVSDVRLRDGLLRLWIHDRDDGRRSEAERALQACLSLAPASMACGPLTVLAGLAWRRGDASVARQCATKALELDSGYSLARLLLRALESDVPSTVWVQAVAATSMRECLLGAA